MPAAATPRVALRLPIALAALFLAGAAHAQASIGDCEKIQAADAYNQCLAKFGPEMKTQNLAPERPGDVKNNSEEAAASAGRSGLAPRAAVRGRGGRRFGVRRAAGGRKRMVIIPRRRYR